MIISRSSQVSVLNYYIFWSENASDILNKAHKKAHLFARKQSFQDFLNDDFNAQKLA